MVRKAAKFAVYDDTMSNVKNHQSEATNRVAGALKKTNQNSHDLHTIEKRREIDLV